MKNDGHQKSILIIKPGAIGDLLQLTPVVRALASAYQGSRISLLVGAQATATLFQHHPLVAETILFDRRGEHRSLLSLLRLWLRIKRGKYSLVVQFQRSNLRAWFLVSAALPCRVLVYHKTRDRTVHVVDDYLDTLAPLGISGQERGLELFVGKADEEFAADVFSRYGLEGGTVIALNPGASHPVNRWGAGRFAALADLLTERMSAKIILIGGSEDRALADEIAAAAASKPQVLCGKATLLQTAAILKKCDLLISGDTGPLHLATAVGTSVLALFGAADPERTGPVGPAHRVIQAKGVACVPCRSRVCKSSRYLECMESISAREVADAAMEMVGEKQKRQV
jgi:ADP-heptose:LPS heptosyltransferase